MSSKQNGSQIAIELDSIMSDFCDNYCRFPHEAASQEALEDICKGCRPPKALATLLLEQIGGFSLEKAE